jgi:hypothetical protein
MKTTNLLTKLAVVVGAGLALSSSVAQAQYNAPAPQLAYGVPQILQLEQAKVSDDTILAYIKNSGNSYGLTADQIIYLKQQGVSDPVITAMLNQPKPAAVAYTPTTPAPQPVAQTTIAPVPTATVAPTVTYVQAAPAPNYYYAQPYYDPSYAWFPPVSLSFAWGGGYYGGWHGGGYGGWNGGGYGGWHGGGYGGWHGGGYGGWHH